MEVMYLWVCPRRHLSASYRIIIPVYKDRDIAVGEDLCCGARAQMLSIAMFDISSRSLMIHTRRRGLGISNVS
jgi:hypothetical protein